MTIQDLKVGDKLRVLIDKKNLQGDNTLNNIIEITNIEEDIYNTLWIKHIPTSFSGGGFRIKDKDNSYYGYSLGVDVELINSEKQCYKYLIKLLKDLNIK